MRFRQPAIFHGLPRDLAVSAPNGGAIRSKYAGSAANGEHVSPELLRAMVKSGSSLNEVYIRHLKECRDCRDFVAEFCPGELKESMQAAAVGSTKRWSCSAARWVSQARSRAGGATPVARHDLPDLGAFTCATGLWPAS